MYGSSKQPWDIQLQANEPFVKIGPANRESTGNFHRVSISVFSDSLYLHTSGKIFRENLENSWPFMSDTAMIQI